MMISVHLAHSISYGLRSLRRVKKTSDDILLPKLKRIRRRLPQLFDSTKQFLILPTSHENGVCYSSAKNPHTQAEGTSSEFLFC